jgi:hypothetical protein
VAKDISLKLALKKNLLAKTDLIDFNLAFVKLYRDCATISCGGFLDLLTQRANRSRMGHLEIEWN